MDLVPERKRFLNKLKDCINAFLKAGGWGLEAGGWVRGWKEAFRKKTSTRLSLAFLRRYFG